MSQFSFISMVGWIGLPKGRPDDNPGSSNPVQFTTNRDWNLLVVIKFRLSPEVIMTLHSSLAAPKVTIRNGKAVTTSLDVANYFQKRHDDVLKKLCTLDCSADFSARNFAGAEYTDEQGKQRPMFEMTKDGFVFLVMGFTGK
ncbi:hypothetical protein SODG_001124 [Sodalis praecaptivus]